MCQFLLSNKKYKYEEFFIDEYKELDEYMIYIEEKIWRIFRLDKVLFLLLVLFRIIGYDL